jgi:D-lactate dehydrogenase (cytochrome)
VVLPDNAAEMAAATAVHDRLVARALALDGTSTGEHGIGLGKMGFLEAEHGSGVDLMRRLKATLDPRGILNPGKVLAGSINVDAR